MVDHKDWRMCQDPLKKLQICLQAHHRSIHKTKETANKNNSQQLKGTAKRKLRYSALLSSHTMVWPMNRWGGVWNFRKECKILLFQKYFRLFSLSKKATLLSVLRTHQSLSTKWCQAVGQPPHPPDHASELCSEILTRLRGSWSWSRSISTHHKDQLHHHHQKCLSSCM